MTIVYAFVKYTIPTRNSKLGFFGKNSHRFVQNLRQIGHWTKIPFTDQTDQSERNNIFIKI
jgi:hypothetical protein